MVDMGHVNHFNRVSCNFNNLACDTGTPVKGPMVWSRVLLRDHVCAGRTVFIDHSPLQKVIRETNLSLVAL